MYLVVKPDGDRLSGSKYSYITDCLGKVAEALKCEGTKVYKLDSLTQVTEVTMQEVTPETANG
jgi:hypothetical protein